MYQMSTHRVLILDSGVGGLSIAGHVIALCPHAHISYIADTSGFPYGTKSPEMVNLRVQNVIAAARHRYDPELIVIACNTASTIALESLRSAHAIPIVGVVPAIKPACLQSKNKVVGVLGTASTVTTEYTQALVSQFAGDCKVYLHGAKYLASLAETKFRGEAIDLGLLQHELMELFDKDPTKSMDTVVLACTHFPLLQNELCEVVSQPIHWIDSGSAIAKRVQHLLCNAQATASLPNPTKNIFCTTGTKTPYKTILIQKILGDFDSDILDIE